MLTYVVMFVLAFGVTAGLIPAIRRRALYYGLVDRGSWRKVHTRPVPRLGGIAIAIGFYAPLVALGFWHDPLSRLVYADRRFVIGLFGGGIAMALVGLCDDVRGLSPRTKLLAQCVVAIAMYAVGFEVWAVANPFGSMIYLGALAAPLTVIWIVGVVNALNLIDGLDGLASGVAFFAVATNLLVAIARAETVMSLLMVTLAGAILGFLIFNFNPASIFMGDTGSMFLGFVLATTSIVTAQKGATAVAVLVPILALGLPIMDTLLAMARRLLTGRSVFNADDEHIHHRVLAKFGYAHRRAVLAMYCLCAFFTLAALGLMSASAPQAALILTVVGAMVFVLMRQLGYLYQRTERADAQPPSAVDEDVST
jgi:UDP-GlcNAc:undecaprenyl-phosphate GlcNAc-1-phosphate transferase